MDVATLFEMDWYDKSPLVSVLRQNQGKNLWIHFSKGAPNRDWQKAKLIPEPEKPTYWDRRLNQQYQRKLIAVRRQNAIHHVPKLGINPKSMWQDPKGIYFYPVDWLLSATDRIRTGNQYGLDAPYYYIAAINLNDPNGVNLDTMTWQDVEALAKRNGWYEQMQAFRQLPSEQQQQQLFHYARPDLPGGFFWHFIDRMVKDGKMRWSQAYRGLSYVRDPNLSIIHSNEPDQILVLDPRIIKVVDSGENKTPIKAGSGADSLEQWWHVLLTIIKQVRGEYGGDLTWKNKRPTLAFSKGWGNFQLAVPERSSVFGEVGLSLTYTYGRAYDSMFIAYKDLINSTPHQIVQTLSERVEKIATRRTDLMFKPIISIDAGKQMLVEQMADHLGMSIKTTISNSEGESRYNAVSLTGEIKREIDRVMVTTQCSLRLQKTDIDGSANLWVGKHHMIATTSPFNVDFTEPDKLFQSLTDKTRENLSYMLREFSPRSAEQTSGYDRHPRFDAALLDPFVGWLISNSGLSFGGTLVEEFAKEIKAYHTYPDKRVLLADIAYAMNSKW